jgi:type II secretory pathway predicted ATPase ExeA
LEASRVSISRCDDQCNERFSIWIHLAGLTMSETTGYVRHQMQIAALASPIFADSTLQLIYKATQGIPSLDQQHLHPCPI